jgi:hypothetical protein
MEPSLPYILFPPKPYSMTCKENILYATKVWESLLAFQRRSIPKMYANYSEIDVKV